MPPPIRKARVARAGSSSSVSTARNSWLAPSTPNSANSQAAPEYTLTLRPLPDCDGIRSLRGLLKIALRRYRLRCVDIRGGGP